MTIRSVRTEILVLMAWTAVASLTVSFSASCHQVRCEEGSPQIELRVTFPDIDPGAVDRITFDAVLETSSGYRAHRLLSRSLPEEARDGEVTFLIDPGRLFWGLAQHLEGQRGFFLELRIQLLGRAETGARRVVAEGVWSKQLQAVGCYLDQRLVLSSTPTCDGKFDGAACVGSDDLPAVCRCEDPSAGCEPAQGSAGLECGHSTCGDGTVDRAAGELCDPGLSATACDDRCISAPLRLQTDAAAEPALSFAPDLSSGEPSGQQALATGFFDLHVETPASGVHLGAGAVLAADFDGDGVVDFAFGYPGGRHPEPLSLDPSYRSRVGKVHVVAGWTGYKTVSEVFLPKLTVVGGREGGPQWLGASLTAGDFDGDGVLDLVIGAPLHDEGAELDAGAAMILRGGPDGAIRPADTGGLVELEDPTSSALYRLITGRHGSTGDASGSLFGYAMASADLDGDGLDDLIVSAPKESSAGTLSGGAVYIFPGSSLGWEAGVTDSVTELDHRVLRGSRPDSFLGVTLAVGDVDLDGVPDLLIGAAAGGGNAHGEAHVLFGAPGLFAMIPVDQDVDSAAGAPDNPLLSLRVDASSSSLRGLGGALASVDLDDDGLPELAISVGRLGSEVPPRGVLLIRGADIAAFRAGGGTPDPTTTGLLLEGRGADAFGATLLARDVSGDGRPDLLIGAPQTTGDASSSPQWGGAVVVLLSTPLTTLPSAGSLLVSEIFDTPTSLPPFGWLRIEGDTPFGQLGAAMTVCPSLGEGDLFRYDPLLLVGEPGWSEDPSSPGQGRVRGVRIPRAYPCGVDLQCTQGTPW